MTPAPHDDPAYGGPAPGAASRLRHIALFFAAPFITLYYLARLPFELPGMVRKLRDPANTEGWLF